LKFETKLSISRFLGSFVIHIPKSAIEFYKVPMVHNSATHTVASETDSKTTPSFTLSSFSYLLSNSFTGERRLITGT
jgi:hypothetical protein